MLKGNQIVGMNNLWESEINKGIETGLIGVRREYRRKGVATPLKHNGLPWAKNNGYESLRTDNVATNEGVLNINIQAGFKFMTVWLVFDKILAEEL